MELELELVDCTECGLTANVAWSPELKKFVWLCPSDDCGTSGDLEPPKDE